MTTREYVGDGVTVRWDSSLCVHSGVCARTLPSVFRPLEQPWVVVTAAAAAEVEAAVALCPSGALTCRRGDDEETTAVGAPEPHEAGPTVAAVTITPTENGPLEVLGPVTLVAADGTTMRQGEKFYLCRCGRSRTKPYCDGSHRKVAFEDPGLGPGR